MLSYGSANPAGGNVAVGDVLTGSLAGGTVFQSTFTLGTITCTAVVVEVIVTSNPAAGGTATFAITELTFTGCTISGRDTICSITLNGTGTGSVTDGPAPEVVITGIDEQIVVCTGFADIKCDYGTTGTGTEGPIVGTVLNPGSGGTITFSNQTVYKLSGLSACGASGSTATFNGTFSDIVDSSVSTHPLVYDN